MTKYPRTYHLPFSPGVTKDDKIQHDLSYIKGLFIVTEKVDGENTTMTRDYIHARSLDSKWDETRDKVYGIWGNIKHDIPEGWRICGENMYTKHSIKYKNLNSYFLVYSIWNERNECLSWVDTKDWCNLLGLITVNVLAVIQSIDDLKDIQINTETQEGYVIRPANSFPFEIFHKVVLKWVREKHVQTDKHWRHSKLEINELKQKEEARN